LTLLGRRLAVSIPDTVLEEKDSPREKTVKVGTIARACAIYGVDTIEIFRDPRGRGEGPWVRKVLEYLETPQYLRRRIYPIDESLKYAGVLPPLRIPSHKGKVRIDQVAVGDVREGLTNGDGTVDVGLDASLRLEGSSPAGRRVTVKIVDVSPPTAVAIPREAAGAYWGYEVEEKAYTEVLVDRRFEVKIATSRLGKPLKRVLGTLSESMQRASGVKLIFGPPSRGLYEIFGRKLTEEAGFVVNLYPEQHVETVRTEEAIFAGLGLVCTVLTGKA
jgi:predicted SPOUT superfamily RNA methylase MTH1